MSELDHDWTIDDESSLNSDDVIEAHRKNENLANATDAETFKQQVDVLIERTQAYRDWCAQKRESQIVAEMPLPPKYFTGGKLRTYQEVGVRWMNATFLSGGNGILADEMGLGKTVQAIAFICHLYAHSKMTQPTLVLGPLNTLRNWHLEFQRFAPKIPVILYHHTAHPDINDKRLAQNTKLLRHSMVNDFKAKHTIEGKKNKVAPVVITNYETLVKDIDKFKKFEFSYFVLDEGHRIKNYDSKLHQSLRDMSISGRLLMTGTPLQNDLRELWSLLNFCQPSIFAQFEWFSKYFDDLSSVTNSSKNANEKYDILSSRESKDNMVSKLHKIMETFMLRRKKDNIPDLKLPPKREVLVTAPMVDNQLELYKLAVAGLDERMSICGVQAEEAPDINLDRRDRSARKKSIDYSFWDRDLSMDELAELDLGYEDSLVKQYTTDLSSKQSVIKELNGFIQKSLKNRLIALRLLATHPAMIYKENDTGWHSWSKERLINESGKMLVLDQMLAKLKQNGHKVLLFTQFRRMIHVLEDYCEYRGYEYRVIDGTIGMTERHNNMVDFNKDPNVFLMLTSTRAGSLGVNLVGADTVIIVDQDFNPQGDLQAQDRAHRIGQTKPVVVYRLISKGSIDESIAERSQNKRRLEKIVVNDETLCNGHNNVLMKKSNFVNEPITLEQLKKLLESTDFQGTFNMDSVSADGTHAASILHEEVLQQLMDRRAMFPEFYAAQSEGGSGACEATETEAPAPEKRGKRAKPSDEEPEVVFESPAKRVRGAAPMTITTVRSAPAAIANRNGETPVQLQVKSQSRSLAVPDKNPAKTAQPGPGSGFKPIGRRARAKWTAQKRRSNEENVVE